MSIVNLSSYLATKIKAISGVDAGQVYEFDNPQMGGFPSIGITLKDWNAVFLTNQENLQRYVFTVRIYQEVAKQNIGTETVESNLRTLADTIIASFNSDNKLNSNDTYTMPIAGRMAWLANQPIRVMEIDIECHDVVSATG